MELRLRHVGNDLRRCAEWVLVAMLAAMFIAFNLQILFRYVLNLPVGWTNELSSVLWLWMVLWGSAFVLRDDEEIRFDLIYSVVRSRIRSAMCIVSGSVLVLLYVISLPAVVDYVMFMRVESSAYLDIRLDWLFSIYVLFAAATILRQLWLIRKALHRS